MIHADQRCSLRQSISLDRRVAQSEPEFLRFRVQRRASADEGPELPAKLAANRAEHPPAEQKMFSYRIAQALAKWFKLSGVFQIALDLLLHRLQNSGHSDQHGYALAANRAHNLRRFQLVLKDHGATEQRRQEYGEKLPEDVAERQ